MQISVSTVVGVLVALRKESVDRNSTELANIRACILSLSARRAWIEISRAANCQHRSHVALRKESVDRNKWIKDKYPGCRVALRKESVDRNCISVNILFTPTSRSPQGERG